MEPEEWRVIPGTACMYCMDRDGMVRKKTIRGLGKIMKKISGFGGPFVCLMVKGKRVRMNIKKLKKEVWNDNWSNRPVHAAGGITDREVRNA